MALSSIEDYENNTIRHEIIQNDIEEDKAKINKIQNTYFEPVILAYNPDSNIDKIIADVIKSVPYSWFDTPDHVTHALWKMTKEDSDAVVKHFEE